MTFTLRVAQALLSLCFLLLPLQAQDAAALAAKLEAAPTDSDRAAILAAEPALKAEAAKILATHGTDLFAKNDPDGALKSYYALLAINLSDSDETAAARTWRRIAGCLARKGDLPGAIAIGEKAVAISTRLADKLNIAEASQQLTGQYYRLGRFDEAETAARRGMAAYNELGEKRRATAMLINLSTALGEKGNQAAKAEFLRQAIQESDASGFKELLGPALNNLGVLYYDQGEYERSLQYMRRAMDLFASDAARGKEYIARTHSNIAVMLARLGQDKEASEEYKLGETMSLAEGEESDAMHARFNRASLYRTTGHPERALEEMRSVAAYYEKSPLRPDALRTLDEYALLMLDLGNPKGAAELAAKNLVEAKSLRSPDLIWLTLEPLADAYMKLGKREEARAAFLEAITAVESIKLSGGEDEKENFLHERTMPYHGMVRLLYEDGNTFEALRFSERAKARLLLDVLRGARAEIARAMTDAEKQRERELSAAVAKVDAALARDGAKATAEQLAQRTKAAIELDQFRALLYQSHPELRLRRGEAPPISLDQVQELLPDSVTALLEFTVTKEAAYLFTIVRGAGAKPKLESFRLANSATLPALIEKFRTQLAARDLGYKATARSLYTTVLGPASAALRRKTKLVIVPDGPLWNLPFQALISASGRHVIEESAVSYAPSLTAAREMLHLRRDDAGTDRKMLAVAGTEPPESLREVRQIGQIYGPQSSTVLSGAESGKQRWKAEAPRYRLLHIATHGVLNSNNPLYSHLVMGGAPEDRLLTAREILGMNLQADISVLSACESARGKYRFGEGMIGMSWAFLVAGTPTTVVSQWKVDSASTSQLMVAFHRNLSKTAGGAMPGRAEALRGAVLQVLNQPEYRHPFYWAGFVMIGNGY